MSSPIVIKIGGAVLDDLDTLATFWQHVQHLSKATPVVMVHGGGKQATALARRLGHEPQIIQGRRVTTDLDLDIVKWTMRGGVNAELVAQASLQGLRAVGLCGADGGLLRVHKRPPWDIDGKYVDFGWVGDIDHIETPVLDSLLSAGFLPIIAPLGLDTNGHLYNVNADTVGLAIAAALGATRLYLVTASGGVRRSADAEGTLLPHCNKETYEQGLAEGWIQGGMGVKLHVAFNALHAGIAEVFILPPDDLLTRTAATRVVISS